MEELSLGRRFLLGDLAGEIKPVHADPVESISLKKIFQAAKEMFENPGTLFSDTGCAHSCVLMMEGRVLCSMEDIGRHNALDKVIGYALKYEIPIPKCAVFSSGSCQKRGHYTVGIYQKRDRKYLSYGSCEDK